ncbi:UNVERIFIED_CONTAM: hypothetical protein Slati_0098800 [Sesamum latifolium]|uniref:Zinc knuckle CX2CX4HX4C domain-containing protein n=1 Tax=Sesamum latifolium TaxID=2727402 RepID=A0AAW2Y9J9_9LAMI
MGSDDAVLVTFTYDRLSNFCYGCGILGHIRRDYERQLEELQRVTTAELPYGPWWGATVTEVEGWSTRVGQGFTRTERDGGVCRRRREEVRRGAGERMRGERRVKGVGIEFSGKRGTTWKHGGVWQGRNVGGKLGK